METEPCTEDVLNEVQDVIEGAIAVMDDVRGPYTRDDRIHAVTAALKHARDILQPVLDEF